MDNLLIVLPLLAALAVVAFPAFRRVPCPDCGDPLAAFRSPFAKTGRMWRMGGRLCGQCGCETDTAGRKVTADTPRPPFPVREWAVLSGVLVAGVGLLAVGVYVTGRPAVAVPPVVVLPQQAPAIPPSN